MTFVPKPRWTMDYIDNSNKIDPQPGHKNEVGDPHWDDHLAALALVIGQGNEGKLSDPCEVHKVLMGKLRGIDDRDKGNYRIANVMVGGRRCPEHWDVPELMREWLEDAQYTCLGQGLQYEPPERKIQAVWRLHVDYEHIHPFIDGNGRSGRLLMVNHAIILGLKPWIVKHAEVGHYYARF